MIIGCCVAKCKKQLSVRSVKTPTRPHGRPLTSVSIQLDSESH